MSEDNVHQNDNEFWLYCQSVLTYTFQVFQGFVKYESQKLRQRSNNDFEGRKRAHTKDSLSQREVVKTTDFF